MTNSESKNLEAITKAIDQHNARCEFPATAVFMNPFEVERLDWESVNGVPIRSDPNIQTGRFRIVCSGQTDSDESETVEAVAQDRELAIAI